MKNVPLRRIAAVMLACAFAAAPAAAKDKEDKAWDKEHKHAEKRAEKAERKADKHAEKHADKHAGKGGKHDDKVRHGGYFKDEHREHARRSYHEHYAGAGKCPPGLAKKNNGCMPPGQARKWAVGQPLPREVVVYEVPRPVLVTLPAAPVGYRYERVGADIVLVRASSRVVVDIMLNVFI